MDSSYDNVSRPIHYNKGSIECLDAIEASMSPEAFRGHLKGCVLKYVWRYESKNGVEDLRKANFYLSRLIKNLESTEAELAELKRAEVDKYRLLAKTGER